MSGMHRHMMPWLSWQEATSLDLKRNLSLTWLAAAIERGYLALQSGLQLFNLEAHPPLSLIVNLIGTDRSRTLIKTLKPRCFTHWNTK